MNKYVIFSLIGLAVIILSAGTTLAYRGDGAKVGFSKKDWQVKHEAMQEQRANMQEIFANQDYDAWKALMEEKVESMQSRVDEMSVRITEENFAKMAEAHVLMEAGDYEAAKALHEELGFGGYKKSFGGHKMGGWYKFGGDNFWHAEK